MRTLSSADLAMSITTLNVFLWKKTEQDGINNYTENWLYSNCLADIFPFNQIEDENEFINECQHKMKYSLKISVRIYKPFDVNSSDDRLCSDFDPDVNFYAEENVFSEYSCRHFLEDQFNEKMNSLCVGNGQNLSLCRINIRSLKANLSQLESYMQGCLLNLLFLLSQRLGLMNLIMTLWRIIEPQNQGVE